MYCYYIGVTCENVELKRNNPNYIDMQFHFIGLRNQKEKLKEGSQTQSKI